MAIATTHSPQLEARTDFEHTLYILPPVAPPHDEVQWFAYIDEPTKWHRRFSDPTLMVRAAAQLLGKMLVFERQVDSLPRNPNYVAGTSPDVPNVRPRWVVRVTADCSEAEPEWTIALQDESAWGATGYDLGLLLSQLERRIENAHVAPQLLLPETPPTVTARQTTSTPATDSSFEKLSADELDRVGREIARLEQTIAGTQAKITALKQEQRALKAACAAYRKHRS